MVKLIKNYVKTIQQQLLPALTNKYGIDFVDNPVSIKSTEAKFSGSYDGNRIILIFYSNHVEVSNDKNLLFVNSYYGFKGNEAGVIDVYNIEEAADIIYSSLYELGLRSEEDKEEEREQETKQQEIPQQRQKQIRQEEPQQEEPQREEPQQEEDSDYSEEEVKGEYDNYLNQLKSMNEINGTISASIAYQKSDNNLGFVHIDLFYISATMCLIQTTGIKPKVDKTVSWEVAKNYIFKVANSINGTVSLFAADENGKEIILSTDDEESEDLDLNIDI